MSGFSVLWICSNLFELVDVANTGSETFADQFLGSPLLVLSAIIIILIGASIYRKIRK
jgi:hypothetical protein